MGAFRRSRFVAARDAQWLVLFDVDIYEPKAFA